MAWGGNIECGAHSMFKTATLEMKFHASFIVAAQ